jgi:hypothetical protein
VRIIDDISIDKWRQIVEKSENATFYHTDTWAGIVEASFDNCKVKPLLFDFEDGTEVLVPLAYCSEVKGLMQGLFSTFPSEYGGPVSGRPVSQDKLDRIFKSLIRIKQSRVTIHNSPFDNITLPKPYKAIPHTTQVIPLDGGMDAVWQQRFQPKTRRGINKSIREGIVIRPGSSDADFEAFYKLYMLSVERWGEKTTWVRPESFCRNIVTMGHPYTRLWLAYLNDKIIGGAIICYFNRIGSHMMQAFDYEYREYRPNSLMVKQAVETACELGCDYYDMGPSAGIPSVIEFKRRFGAIPIDYNVYSWENPVYTVYMGLRRNILHAK